MVRDFADLGVILPMVGGMATASLFGLPLYWEGILVGTILTTTSVSISAQRLMELGALRSRRRHHSRRRGHRRRHGHIVLSLVVAFARAPGGGAELIGRQVFSAAVIMVLATTMVTPPLLRLTFPQRPFARDVTVEETVGHPPRVSR